MREKLKERRSDTREESAERRFGSKQHFEMRESLSTRVSNANRKHQARSTAMVSPHRGSKL